MVVTRTGKIVKTGKRREKAMKGKRFLSVVLSVCLALLTLFSFVGCGKNEAEELKKQIAELNQTVEELEEQLQTEKNNNAGISHGFYYTIEEAYTYGYLSEDDIKHIIYLAFGRVLNQDGEEIAFSPSKSLNAVNKKQEDALKKLYAKNYLTSFWKNGETNDEKSVLERFTLECHGEYKGVYPVTLNSEEWVFPMGVRLFGAAGYYYVGGEFRFAIFIRDVEK